jgi:ferrous iron transport protein A
MSAPRAPSSAVIPLSTLTPGSAARIASVDSASPAGRRLADLGFLPHTEIRVVRRAPLGDPVAYELRGYRLCLRRAEAALVLVEPIAPPATAP